MIALSFFCLAHELRTLSLFLFPLGCHFIPCLIGSVSVKLRWIVSIIAILTVPLLAFFRWYLWTAEVQARFRTGRFCRLPLVLAQLG